MRHAARPRADWTAGKISAIRTVMMAMTTSSSISVKPRRWCAESPDNLMMGGLQAGQCSRISEGSLVYLNRSFRQSRNHEIPQKERKKFGRPTGAYCTRGDGAPTTPAARKMEALSSRILSGLTRWAANPASRLSQMSSSWP